MNKKIELPFHVTILQTIENHLREKGFELAYVGTNKIGIRRDDHIMVNGELQKISEYAEIITSNGILKTLK